MKLFVKPKPHAYELHSPVVRECGKVLEFREMSEDIPHTS
jgi:hypothetical protein